uniref:Uncharacterized protein n=1 Tax=Podoviridae sp. ctTZV6 TaxID=2826556 RepID=A0A8S5NCA0_9CAUD|nr:MAG TPA: hypothetical protein [Podoviridae sp. ctTZV6]
MFRKFFVTYFLPLISVLFCLSFYTVIITQVF